MLSIRSIRSIRMTRSGPQQGSKARVRCWALAAVAFMGFSATATASLSFEERVACRAKVEDVYWAHRIWPHENRSPKPARETVEPYSAIAQRVEESLLYEMALETLWRRLLSPELIQAEIDREARSTRDPAMLRELWATLGDDPTLVAECLVRPELAERWVRESYANDRALHAATRRRAESELAAASALAALDVITALRAGDGEVAEVVWVKERGRRERRFQPGVMSLPDEEWKRFTSALVAAELPLGKLSALRENSDHFYAQMVQEQSAEKVRVVTVSWPKQGFARWWQGAGAVIAPLRRPAAATGQPVYSLPARISGAACALDAWTATETAGAPIGRYSHTAVWTGSEMIVWGGNDGSNFISANSGSRYRPGTDTWAATSLVNAPAPRAYHTAVWTGTEMIVWGGYDGGTSGFENSGGRYTPGTDTWVATRLDNAPAPRLQHTAVWTGSEMIIWGGGFDAPPPQSTGNTGGRYTPATDHWVATSTANAPPARAQHTAVWTGSEMIVWGGSPDNGSLTSNSGGRYTPGSDSWAATSSANAPSARSWPTSVWTGSDMIVWGGQDAGVTLSSGGRYTPGSDSWVATASTNAPEGRLYHTAAWTGSQMIVWGGFGSSGLLDSGGLYCAPIIVLPTSFFTVPSCRLVDTRGTAGPRGAPALQPGAQRTFVLSGACGIPATAKALSLNVTIIRPTAAGDLRIFPEGSAAPLISVIDFSGGQTRANNLIATLGSGGLTVQLDSSGTAEMILDLSGYFE